MLTQNKYVSECNFAGLIRRVVGSEAGEEQGGRAAASQEGIL